MFNPSKTLKIAVVALALTSVTACGIVKKHRNKPTVGQKYREARQTTNPEKLIVNQRAPNDFKIYFGSKKGKGSVMNVGGENFHVATDTIDRGDFKMVFVSKTNEGKPALGIRLNNNGVAKLNKASKAGYSEVMASMNGNIFSRTEGASAKLADGVLLMPMPTLVSARDAADAVRSPTLN